MSFGEGGGSAKGKEDGVSITIACVKPGWGPSQKSSNTISYKVCELEEYYKYC